MMLTTPKIDDLQASLRRVLNSSRKHPCEARFPSNVVVILFQYSKLSQKSEEALKELRKEVDTLNLIEMTLHTAEVPGVNYEEKVDYSFTELISETGGSMGIFLGLSLVDVFALLRMLSQASFIRKLVKYRVFFKFLQNYFSERNCVEKRRCKVGNFGRLGFWFFD